MIQSDDEIKRFFGTVERIGRKRKVKETRVIESTHSPNYIRENKRKASVSAHKQSLNVTQDAFKPNKNDLMACKGKEARLKKETSDRNAAAANLARHDIRKAHREQVF